MIQSIQMNFNRDGNDPKSLKNHHLLEDCAMDMGVETWHVDAFLDLRWQATIVIEMIGQDGLKTCAYEPSLEDLYVIYKLSEKQPEVMQKTIDQFLGAVSAYRADYSDRFGMHRQDTDDDFKHNIRYMFVATTAEYFDEFFEIEAQKASQTNSTGIEDEKRNLYEEFGIPTELMTSSSKKRLKDKIISQVFSHENYQSFDELIASFSDTIQGTAKFLHELDEDPAGVEAVIALYGIEPHMVIQFFNQMAIYEETQPFSHDVLEPAIAIATKLGYAKSDKDLDVNQLVERCVNLWNEYYDLDDESDELAIIHGIKDRINFTKALVDTFGFPAIKEILVRETIVQKNITIVGSLGRGSSEQPNLKEMLSEIAYNYGILLESLLPQQRHDLMSVFDR